MEESNLSASAAAASRLHAKCANSSAAAAVAEEKHQIDPVEWSVETVCKWLETLGPIYGQYKSNFVDNGVDGKMLKELNNVMLQEVKIETSLHRTKILIAKNELFGY